MNGKCLIFCLATLLAANSKVLACEYKPGETSFLDYANCKYGAESILVVDLPKGSGWEQCIYYLQAFRPETLLAITKQQDGKEILSTNNRSQIGNPCYMMKRSCDTALAAYNESAQ